MARSPYPGLRPFERDEADIFFGRETHVDAMVDRLGHHHFLAVTGTSGCGKSSLVKAGLIEALEIGLLAETGPVWRVAQLRPRDHPMAELASSLVLAQGGDRYENDIALRQAALERGPLALVEELTERPLADGGNLLIVVDQCEELFRYRDRGLAGREEAEAFVALLRASAGQRAVPIHVVVTMRSDFLGECAQFEGLAEAVSDAQYLCPRLTRDQIVAAIEGPAAVFGGKVETLLVSRIVNDMGTDPDQLPLMQHALMRLWDEAKTRDPAAPVLRLDDYLAADGIKGSLSRHADEILAEITRDQRERAETARRLFCLVTEGEIRRLARVDEVTEVSGQPLAEVASVADAFRAPGRSLLMPSLDRPLDPETVLDISHESLIRQWQTLKDWARAEMASAEQYRETERRARRWEAGTADLWVWNDLANALAWRERERPSAAWAARYGGDFVLAMRFLDQSRNVERRRRLRVLLGTAAAFAVVLLLLVLVGWQWKEAQTQSALAERALAVTITTSDLLLNFAEKLEHVAGMPVALTKEILDQARGLQDTFVAIAKQSPRLSFIRAQALEKTAELLRVSLGGTKGALDAATQARDIFKALLESSPDDTSWQYDLSAIDNTIGDVLNAQGRLDEALAAYSESLGIAEGLARKIPGNAPLLQRGLSNSYLGIGDVLKQQGHLDNALAVYRDALAIDEALAEQHNMARINQRIGDVLVAQGHLNEALVPYGRCLDIMRALAQKDPGNTLVQRNLAASHNNIGDILKAQGHLDDALAAQRDSRAISMKLAATDPDNTLSQGDLAVSGRKIGDALVAQGHLDEALAAYRDSLAITKRLAQKDPDNPEWQRSLAAGNEGIGDVLKAQGDPAKALDSYSDGLAIRTALAQENPGNTQWQGDLAADHRRIGDVLVAQGHLDDAFVAHNDSLAIRKALVLKDASNTEWQSDLSESEVAIGDVYKAQGHPGEALAAYRNSLTIRMTLTEKDPGNVLWQTDLAISLHKVASAGGEPEANLAEAIAILKRLEAAGVLWPEKKALMLRLH